MIGRVSWTFLAAVAHSKNSGLILWSYWGTSSVPLEQEFSKQRYEEDSEYISHGGVGSESNLQTLVSSGFSTTFSSSCCCSLGALLSLQCHVYLQLHKLPQANLSYLRRDENLKIHYFGTNGTACVASKSEDNCSLRSEIRVNRGTALPSNASNDITAHLNALILAPTERVRDLPLNLKLPFCRGF